MGSDPAVQLLAAPTRRRPRLVDEVRRRLARQSDERGDDPRDLAWQAAALDPQALTIGFARRVPTYKRLTLLLHQRERLFPEDLDKSDPWQFKNVRVIW